MACLLLLARMGCWSASTCAHAAASQHWTRRQQLAPQVRALRCSGRAVQAEVQAAQVIALQQHALHACDWLQRA